jgi:hypothetical protein
MARKPAARKPRATPGTWFDSFPPVDPPGWDDKQGWCRRHWAPLAGIPDPAQRAEAQRLAALDLTITFAFVLRRKITPLPVPAHHIAELVRQLAPVCCNIVGDSDMQSIILAAMTTAGATDATIEGYNA